MLMNLIRNHLLLFCLVSSSTLFAKILVDECKPPQNYANKKQQDAIDITAESIVFITHSSRLFDPLGLTKNSMNHLVSESKNNSFPVYYLHDSWNPYNPFSSYLYDDCEPDAYIQSDIGFHFLNLKNVRSIYVAGGYYEMCERNTITSAIDNWVAIDSHSSTPMTFHIYQITDAVFSIGENIRSADENTRAYT